MPNQKEMLEVLGRDSDLKEATDYNIGAGKTVVVLTVAAMVALIDSFGEDALKEAEKAGILIRVNGVDYDMEI